LISTFNAWPQSLGDINTPFVNKISQIGERSYYSLDLKQLPEFLERACLLEFLFKDEGIVVLETNISGEILTVFSGNDQDTGAITSRLNSYPPKVREIYQSLTPESRQALTEKYSKYR
jgi:hypothetical protein